MKYLLFACLFSLSFIFSSLARARTTYTTGYSQEMGFCSYSQGFFCIERIKERTESKGKHDAEWSCQLHQGRPASYTGHCNSSCFPNFLSPLDQNTLVHCNATCTVQCEVQD